MRSLVRRILSRYDHRVIAIFYTLILLSSLSYASETNAQKAGLAALLLQTQTSPGTPAPAPKKKSLTQLRNDEAPEGSRVTITYNEPLSDYSAYWRGNHYVIVIPKADAPRVSSGLRGRAFDGVQVEKRGDDTILLFRIQPGVKARVNQQYNRLEVLFSSPGRPAAKAATSPQQTAAATSLTSTGKAPQDTQTTAGLPQTPLANHNSTVVDASQTGTGGASVDSSANKSNTEKATPVAAPRTGFATARTLLSRHWLPILIAALLLISIYLAIAARRRTELSSSSSNGRIPVARAEVIEAGAEETEALHIDNSAEITSRGDEAAAQAEETEIAAEANVTQKPADEDAATEASALTEASPLTAAVTFPANQHEEREGSASESPVIKDEATGAEIDEEPETEAIEIAATATDQMGASATEADQILLNEEPAAVDEVAAAHASETILNGVSSAMASAWAAAMLDLPQPGSEDAFGKISAAFDHPSQPVRNAAARALFNFSPDRVASFKRIMQESSTQRRRRIGAAIASSGLAMEAIHDLTSRSGARAYEALLVLSLMAKAGEVKSLILTIEEHPSTEVRLALVKLLALSGQQEALSAIRHLATLDSLPVAVRSSVLEAIRQLNKPGAFDLSSA